MNIKVSFVRSFFDFSSDREEPGRGIAPPYLQVMSLTWKPKTTHPVKEF